MTLDQELTPQMLLDLGRAFDSFDPTELESYSVPIRYGFENNRTVSVVYALDDELAPLLALMRGVDPTDPSTVRVSVEVAPDATGEGEALAELLGRLGFDAVEVDRVEGLADGLSLVHGPDGLQAAQVVAEALAANGRAVATLVEAPDVVGRDVILTIGAMAPVVSPSTTASAPSSTAPSSTAPSSTAASSTTVPTTTVPTTTVPTGPEPAIEVVAAADSVRRCD